jgi:hypothetical protein
MNTKLSLTGAIVIVLAAALVVAVSSATATRAASSRANGPAAAVSSSALPHVLGYGHQQGPKKTDLFGIFAQGSGNQASGTMSAYPGTKLKTATITCLVVNGNDAIVTGHLGTQIWVAELVDNADPSDPSNPDLLRFSFDPFISPDPANPGCYLPMLSPIGLKSGDLSVVPGP